MLKTVSRATAGLVHTSSLFVVCPWVLPACKSSHTVLGKKKTPFLNSIANQSDILKWNPLKQFLYCFIPWIKFVFRRLLVALCVFFRDFACCFRQKWWWWWNGSGQHQPRNTNIGWAILMMSRKTQVREDVIAVLTAAVSVPVSLWIVHKYTMVLQCLCLWMVHKYTMMLQCLCLSE